MKKIEYYEHTIFDNKYLCIFFRACSHLLLKLFGWKFEGDVPQEEKLIVVGAPHTSNRDFLIMLAVIFISKRKVYWLGKHSLFCFPFKAIFKWLGGIAVERGKRNSVTDQVSEMFANKKELALVLSPEGTRNKTDHWKKGFYHIALKAKIPVFLGSINLRSKKARIRRKAFVPTGNIVSDMEKIKNYYGGMLGNISQLASIR